MNVVSQAVMSDFKPLEEISLIPSNIELPEIDCEEIQAISFGDSFFHVLVAFFRRG